MNLSLRWVQDHDFNPLERLGIFIFFTLFVVRFQLRTLYCSVEIITCFRLAGFCYTFLLCNPITVCLEFTGG